MQDKKVTKEYVLVSVPAELLVTAGIFAGDAIQMHVEGDKLVIESADSTESPVCGGDGRSCPCSGECKESGVA